MASMNMDKQLDEQQPAKKPRIDNPEEEGEIANSNEAGLPKSVEMMEREESGTSTTIVDLPIRHPLPLELNCEIFKCLKLPIQKKFIWGLGRGIYAMFGQKLLKKTKRVRNPHGNHWDGNPINTRATIAADGLNVHSKVQATNVFAEQPFPIFGPLCRADEFPGTICYYYEVKVMGDRGFICGLSFSAIPDDLYLWIGRYPNSYAIQTDLYLNGYDDCWIDGDIQPYGLTEGAIRPSYKPGSINVFGCGLVLDSEDKLWNFFHIEWQAHGSMVDRLFPAVTISPNESSSFEANFGDDLAKPFEYDIKSCPGLELDCI